ncbi:hypothetical protein QTG54_002206 [Skeletonema marinoi]|uniref:MYND-type domain-containing protein n=1 Tax=Skeletonema marinoi TaxID=267567 RepID=A0AAD9DH05_9STRA|nr:hypothetical protein QTG54_002206 [Skeletonema marinoi]
MSTKIVVSESDNMMRCASCGIAEDGDNKKLKTCTACKSVRYCSVTCQKEHRPKHKRACKKKAAELRDELLFKQPESNQFGDCPICLLPQSNDPEKSSMGSCCSKVICGGCAYANHIRLREAKLEESCPFCRQPPPDNNADVNRNIMKRTEANDPAAICMMGFILCNGGDYQGAFDHYKKAAELVNSAEAHYQLAWTGVEKDTKKKVYHLEHAAIGGHAMARYNLGVNEQRNGRLERAIKHWIISAKLGYDRAAEALKVCFREGSISKDVFAEALRAHQAAVDATKSPQREVAEAAMQKMRAARAARQNYKQQYNIDKTSSISLRER